MNALLAYRRSRSPGAVSGVFSGSLTPNGLWHVSRPKMRLPGAVSITTPPAVADFDAWLDSVTPFTTIGDGLVGTANAWLDAVTPFTELT